MNKQSITWIYNNVKIYSNGRDVSSLAVAVSRVLARRAEFSTLECGNDANTGRSANVFPRQQPHSYASHHNRHIAMLLIWSSCFAVCQSQTALVFRHLVL